VTDKLRSYGVAHRELIPESIHDTEKYANNRAELSHQPTRVRERGMRKFKSVKQAQRFLNVHAAVYNLFNWDVIWYQLRLIDFSDCVPLRLGKMQRQFRFELGWIFRTSTVNLAVPAGQMGDLEFGLCHTKLFECLRHIGLTSVG